VKSIVLAGGIRLWPLSRQQLPKQFLKLMGEESLLAAIISRLSPMVAQDDVLTVAKNESTYIPIGEKHRLANKGKIPLQMIEVQVGDI